VYFLGICVAWTVQQAPRFNSFKNIDAIFAICVPQVPQGDLDKRRREQEEKKSKLRNPLFFVNPLRLSVRNLSKSVSDEELRKTLLEGARRGIQEGKVSVDDITLHLQAGAQAIPSETKVGGERYCHTQEVKATTCHV
jgi:hypothetical protein